MEMEKAKKELKEAQERKTPGEVQKEEAEKKDEGD